MKPDPTAAAADTTAQPKAAEKEPEPQVDIDADFMKDVIGDLGIDIGEKDMENILKEAKKPEDKDKKDDEQATDKK